MKTLIEKIARMVASPRRLPFIPPNCNFQKILEDVVLGIPEAENRLGWIYLSGGAGQQDYAEAAKWFRCAAEQGHAEAQNRLGEMYEHGWGVPLDYSEAVLWYRRAAVVSESEWLCYRDSVEAGKVEWDRDLAGRKKAKVAKVQYNLGRMFLMGWGVLQDDALAARCYRAAAYHGESAAAAILGFLYATGRCDPQNDAEGKERIPHAKFGRELIEGYAEKARIRCRAAEQSNEFAR